MYTSERMLDHRRRFVAIAALAVLAGVAAALVRSSRQTTPNAIDAKLPHALASAAAFLQREQSQDGSWPSFLSKQPDFSQAREQTRVYPATFIVRSLRASPYARTPWMGRAERYIASVMETGHVWSVDGKQHDLSYRFDRLSCFVVPDTETTAVALLVLQDQSPLRREDLSELLARYETLKHDTGLYRSYWLGFYGARGCPADYGNRPSLGSNLNVLAFMFRFGGPAERLRAAIFKYLESTEYPEGLVYFRSHAVLAQIASALLEVEPNTGRALTERFLDDFEKSGVLREPTQLHALDLAGYVHAKCAVFKVAGAACSDLRPLVAELLRRQTVSGAWPPGHLYEAGLNDDGTGTKHYYGSSAETTAAAMQALLSYSSANASTEGD
jgi:hypothetical protein